jgi:iron complex transport system permease protein
VASRTRAKHRRPEARAARVRSSTPSFRRWAGLLILAGLLAVAVALSVALGSVRIGLGDVIAALTSFDGSDEHVIVRDMRVPRTLVGLAVGTGLALSGALMQGLTRNALADPGILGISQGASLAVVLAILTLGVSSTAGYVWFAFAGAAIAAVVVHLLGGAGDARSAPVTLALAGSALAAFLMAITSAVLVLDATTLDQYRFWVVGSLAGRDMDVFWSVIPFLAAGLLLALCAGRWLNALGLGEDVARSLGLRLGAVRALVAVAVVLLAGASVAAAGPIGFVGLAVPHAVRLVVGTDWRWVLAYCALTGPVLLLTADVVGRLVVPPGELQVGIVTALVGVPVFVALARRRRLAEL